ncbi:hypothetical protein [Spiroplasma cantharicola]|uniref:hypothetical protein n=1 Tax=Spiroplasma cantharicola TaxID=362837 RepID=UPI0006B654A3|nr:hypothetical protein [Spiroplasma cantharicola]
MKKIINFFGVATLLNSTIITVISCGGTPNYNSFYETNYNKAFQTVFKNEKNIQIKEFSMFPELVKNNKIPEPESKEKKYIEQLILSGNEFKLNCEEFICKNDNFFYGKKLTSIEYGNLGEDKNIKERIKTQYALDDLASWFNIEPNTKPDFFYDYTNLELTLDYSKNIYFFKKYREEQDLILWSKQNSLEIVDKSKDKKINTEFNFFDKNFILDQEIIKKLVLADLVEINTEEVTESSTKEGEKQNILKIYFKNIDKLKTKEKVNNVKSLFYSYQQDIEFKLINNTIKNNLENDNENYETINLESFNIDNKKISKIILEINIKEDNNEKNNSYII